MPIVFNVYAFFQAIIIALILGALYLILRLFGVDVDNAGGHQGSVITIQIMAFLAALTDVKCIKGRLFYMPTWLFLMGTGWYMLTTSYELRDFHKWMFGLSCVFIVLFYCRQLTRELRKTWSKKKDILLMILAGQRAGNLNDTQYWALASNFYFQPSNFFLFANPLWKLIFRNAIDADDFLVQYRSFMNTMPIEHIPKERLRSWATEFKTELNRAQSFSDYNHPYFAITRLASVIDESHKALK